MMQKMLFMQLITLNLLEEKSMSTEHCLNDRPDTMTVDANNRRPVPEDDPKALEDIPRALVENPEVQDENPPTVLGTDQIAHAGDRLPVLDDDPLVAHVDNQTALRNTPSALRDAPPAPSSDPTVLRDAPPAPSSDPTVLSDGQSVAVLAENRQAQVNETGIKRSPDSYHNIIGVIWITFKDHSCRHGGLHSPTGTVIHQTIDESSFVFLSFLLFSI